MASSTQTRTSRSVVVDSSVFFAAAYSPTGSAHELLQEALQGGVVLVLSDYVFAETERNLRENAPRALPAFLRLRGSLPYRLRNPSRRLVQNTARVVEAKDAPIVASARSARVKLVATYDRKHLIAKRTEIEEAFGVTVATPAEILVLLGLR
jgi:predicted nucleic acid-binding protein